MRQCWRCRTTKNYVGSHHINRNHNDSRSFNKIGLCKRCHDVIQGVCDKCSNQPDCHIKRFQQCWYFDDAIPPIYYRPYTDGRVKDPKLENLNNINRLSENGENDKTSMISADKGTETNRSLTCRNRFCSICGSNVPSRLVEKDKEIVCANCRGKSMAKQNRNRNRYCNKKFDVYHLCQVCHR